MENENYIKSFEDEYNNNSDNYTTVCKIVRELLENILISEDIQFFRVESRVKTLESINEKIERKGAVFDYDDILDICGLRVILYLSKDIQKVRKIIENLFTWDPHHSDVFNQRLNSNSIGYNSFHYICSFDKDRAKLSEYYRVSKIKFEIQIRTVLQHAWATISHDSGYKLEKSLPTSIERKLNLCSGSLEMIDNFLSEIVEAIDNHNSNISAMSIEEVFLQEISEDSIRKYFELSNKFKKLNVNIGDPYNISSNIYNLRLHKIFDISDLDKIITKNMLVELDKYYHELTLHQILTIALVIDDPVNYFASPYTAKIFYPETIKILRKLIGNQPTSLLISKNDVEIVDRRTVFGKTTKSKLRK